MTGSDSGHVTVWRNFTQKSRKIFDKHTQTLVKFTKNKIYAIGEQLTKLTALDMQLNTLKVPSYEFCHVKILDATNDYIVVGDNILSSTNGKSRVTVFDTEENYISVSTSDTASVLNSI